RDIGALPAPARLAAAGLYHPAAPAPFAAAEPFRTWAGTRGWADRPVVAIAIADGMIRDMQTEIVDAVVAALAEKGLLAAPFWSDD
ncbi:cobaltochelatase subunit CobN, partial [Chromohalobacter sp. HP20-39]|uniref:cobaltochelatase subunit CobN n=1 Tax=Chromohalobacter sp. HP20-39 TaxID=3079306 RepID=UPI00294B18C9